MRELSSLTADEQARVASRSAELMADPVWRERAVVEAGTGHNSGFGVIQLAAAHQARRELGLL